MPHRSRTALAALALALAVLVAACGSSSSTKAASTTTTTTAGPKRIVSLSPTATETLFAIGAGSQVVAADKNSNYPTSAPTTKLDAYDPNVEAIAGYKPDLVVLSNDTKGVVKGLHDLSIPTLLEAAPADLAGMYAEIADLGAKTGHAAKAGEVVDSMKRRIKHIVDRSKVSGVSYYYELDNTFYTQTSRTFLGQLLATVGLRNIADAAKATSDYPQLSAEYIVKSDPDLVLLADTKCCQQSASTVAARPGWGALKAVRTGGVVPLDDDVASRWGPRAVDLLDQVATAAAKAKSAA